MMIKWGTLNSVVLLDFRAVLAPLSPLLIKNVFFGNVTAFCHFQCLYSPLTLVLLVFLRACHLLIFSYFLSLLYLFLLPSPSSLDFVQTGLAGVVITIYRISFHSVLLSILAHSVFFSGLLFLTILLLFSFLLLEVLTPTWWVPFWKFQAAGQLTIYEGHYSILFSSCSL